MLALIVGGGKLGTAVARDLLVRGHEVTIVERDDDRAEEIRESLPGIAVAVGDGDEPFVLESARVSQSDAVLALSGEDEDNLVACLLAKREYGVPFTAGRVNDLRNEWLFDERFGVDLAASGTHLAADLLADRLSAVES